MIRRILFSCVFIVALVGCFSYVPPDPPVNWTRMLSERVPEIGDELLRSPLVSNDRFPVLLLLGGMSDSTRFSVEASLLLNKMKAHLINKGIGRIQVFDSSADIEKMRFLRAKESMHRKFKSDVLLLAEQVSKKYRRRNIKIAVQSVRNQRNVGNVCADGFISLLRDEIMANGMGNITFVDVGSRDNVDYLLGGEFVKIGLSGADAPSGEDSRDEQKLHVTLTDAKTGDIDFEASLTATSRDFAPSLGATYVLKGSLEEMSRSHYSSTDDYMRMEFNLVDPDSTLVKWTGFVELAITHNESILYR